MNERRWPSEVVCSGQHPSAASRTPPPPWSSLPFFLSSGVERTWFEDFGDDRLLIVLKPAEIEALTCSRCGQQTSLIHDVSTRRVRERVLILRKVWLDVPVIRVRCARCGPTTERIP